MAMFLPLMLMFGFAMEAEQQTNSSGKRIARRTKEFTMGDLPKLAANISPGVMGSFFKFKLYLRIVFRILKAVEIENYIDKDPAVSGPPKEPLKPQVAKYLEVPFVAAQSFSSPSAGAKGKGTPSKEQKQAAALIARRIATAEKEHAQVQRDN